MLLLVLIGIANVVQNQSSEQVDCQTEIILTETYTDEENGFSFQYPSSWKVVSKDSFTDYLDTLITLYEKITGHDIEDDMDNLEEVIDQKLENIGEKWRNKKDRDEDK